MSTKLYLFIAFFAIPGLISFSCNSKGKAGPEPDNVPTIDTIANKSDTSSTQSRLDRLNDRLKYSPENYDLYYQRSLLYYELGNTEQAIKDIDRSLDFNDQAPETWHLKGYYAYIQNDNELALKLFKESSRMGSDNPETFYTMGQINFLKGNFQDAENYYNTALSLDPMDPIYYFAKGFLFETQNEMKEAEEMYNLSLEKDSSFIKSLSQLHDLYLNHHKDAGKASMFNDRILAISAGHPIGHFNQGNMFFRMANTITDPVQTLEFESTLQMAVSEYSYAIQSDNSFTKALYNRGYCFFLMDKYNEALADFARVVELDPANEKAHFMQGSINEYFGDFQTALANYQEALKVNPEFGDAATAVREMQTKLGQGLTTKK